MCLSSFSKCLVLLVKTLGDFSKMVHLHEMPEGPRNLIVDDPPKYPETKCKSGPKLGGSENCYCNYGRPPSP